MIHCNDCGTVTTSLNVRTYTEDRELIQTFYLAEDAQIQKKARKYRIEILMKTRWTSSYILSCYTN